VSLFLLDPVVVPVAFCRGLCANRTAMSKREKCRSVALVSRANPFRPHAPITHNVPVVSIWYVDTGCRPLPKPEGPTWLAPQPASPHAPPPRNSVFRDGQNGSRGLVAREVVAWRVVVGEPNIPEAFAPGTRAHSVTITDTANDACNSPCWPEYVHGSR
jgi:hypothetical protein